MTTHPSMKTMPCMCHVLCGAAVCRVPRRAPRFARALESSLPSRERFLFRTQRSLLLVSLGLGRRVAFA